MLPKRGRFTSRTFPKGRSKDQHRFSWGTASVYPSDTSYAAVVVSKKVFRRAVDRNRARRRVYAALRDTNAKQVSVVVHVRRDIVDATHAALVADLKKVALQ